MAGGGDSCFSYMYVGMLNGKYARYAANDSHSRCFASAEDTTNLEVNAVFRERSLWHSRPIYDLNGPSKGLLTCYVTSAAYVSGSLSKNAPCIVFVGAKRTQREREREREKGENVKNERAEERLLFLVFEKSAKLDDDARVYFSFLFGRLELRQGRGKNL